MAQDIQLGIVEAKFADIIWEREPVTSSELVRIASTELGWKRTTTHTVLRRLCDKGLFINEGGMVRKIMARQDFYANQSRQYVKNSFSGSLPAFIAAFTRNHKLKQTEIEEIKKMIEEAGDK